MNGLYPNFWEINKLGFALKFKRTNNGGPVRLLYRHCFCRVLSLELMLMYFFCDCDQVPSSMN